MVLFFYTISIHQLLGILTCFGIQLGFENIKLQEQNQACCLAPMGMEILFQKAKVTKTFAF
jgi:hypothetical protein